MASAPGQYRLSRAPTPENATLPVPADHVRSSRFGQLSLESALYLLILLLAIASRFWDLGSRALHHDESLHAYFSWIFADGYGYQHHPLMHGPVLFHATALMYLLLGASDTVSRLIPAGLGVAVVMAPWLLRGERQLGRWGALSASALLLISPSILYYSRFIRHDIFALIGELALFIAVMRYVERPERRWVLLGLIATGYLLTTEELSFIVLFVFALVLAVALVYRVVPALLAVAAGTVVALLAAWVIVTRLSGRPLPAIPWEQPSSANIRHFAAQLLTHPLTLSLAAVVLLAALTAFALLRRRAAGRGWRDGLLGDAPAGSTAAATRALLADRPALLIGVGVSLVTFVALYTSLFTNLMGLASGTVGAVGYWLGQQGVQRAEQPWFYYLLLLPQYEYVGVALFPLGLAWQAARLLRLGRAGRQPDQRDLLRAFLSAWTLGMLAVLSWAGEKMPWIVVHLTLPLTLFAASFAGPALGRLAAAWRAASATERSRLLWLGVATLAACAAGFLLLAWASGAPYAWIDGAYRRPPRPELAGWRWSLVYLPWLGLLASLALASWRLGARRSLLVVGLAGTLAISVAEIHAGWRVTYRDGDIPYDMLIYVQTSPDVPSLVDDLRQLSQQQTGGLGLEVWYDDRADGVQWPLNWYLRDFPNHRIFTTPVSGPFTVPVVIVSDESRTPAIEQALSDYSYQSYPLRWWYPEEETYRRFAYAPELKSEARQNYQDSAKPPFGLRDVAGSVLRSLWAMRRPAEQAKVFRAVTYRELPVPIGSVGFRVYVRDDLLPYFNAIRYAPSTP